MPWQKSLRLTIRMSLLVGVATQSEIKVNAVKSAFDKHFPGCEFFCERAASKINEQPIGWAETMLG